MHANLSACMYICMYRVRILNAWSFGENKYEMQIKCKQMFYENICLLSIAYCIRNLYADAHTHTVGIIKKKKHA